MLLRYVLNSLIMLAWCCDGGLHPHRVCLVNALNLIVEDSNNLKYLKVAVEEVFPKFICILKSESSHAHIELHCGFTIKEFGSNFVSLFYFVNYFLKYLLYAAALFVLNELIDVV